MGPKPKGKKEDSKSKTSSKSKSKEKKDKKKKDDKKTEKSKDKGKKGEKGNKEKEDKEKETSIVEPEAEGAKLITNLAGESPGFPGENINSSRIQDLREKCEGCFNGDGYCFCTDCGKIYCKICDDQLHVVPAYRNHERFPLESFSELKINCYHHNQPLRLFCEVCHEPICKKCQILGPHNSSLHQISSLFMMYRKYIDICKTLSNGPLKQKLSKIEDSMILIDNLLKDNKNKAKEMLHGISLEYENITENITKIEGKKKAELSFIASDLQKDIIAIQSLLELVDSKNKNSYSNSSFLENAPKKSLGEDENDKMLNFLLQYKSLISDIDQVISKPTNRIITEEDEKKILEWPKELNDSKEKLANYPKYKALLKVKDDIIWNLLKTPYEERNKELEEIAIKTQKEVEEWTKLVEKYALELTKYNLVCSFCGGLLEEHMNNICPLNDTENPYENRNLTVEIPPQNMIGNNKHYFAEPTLEYQEKINKGELFDVNQVIRERKRSKYDGNYSKQNQSFINNLIRKRKEGQKDSREMIRPSISNEWVFKAARIIEKEKINLFQVLSEFDHGDGYINSRELILAFTKIRIILTDEDKDSLEKYISFNKYHPNKIDIKKFSCNFGKTTMFNLHRQDSECMPRDFVDNSSNGFQNNIEKSDSYYERLIQKKSMNPPPVNRQGEYSINTSVKYSRDFNKKIEESKNSFGTKWAV